MEQDFIKNIQDIVIPNVSILIIGASFVILVFCIWLIMRGIRLWYWKTDAKMAAIDRIDKAVEEIKTEIKASSATINAAILSKEGGAKENTTAININCGFPGSPGNIHAIQTTTAEEMPAHKGTADEITEAPPLAEATGETVAQATASSAEATGETGATAPEKEISKEETLEYNTYSTKYCCKAKDGKVYTREEIMATIKE